ncbi:FlxA-like family protein [Cedecea neteri]|uniref:FlxA-like family protein n=1 Tax=Cedecea neteri TaxID=158822 RepID=UPI002AA8CDCD|nr:FlxA-like family protein [Cedecea neteri]WPU21935.1 FlxA-like family protein [Cedecea neteri]
MTSITVSTQISGQFTMNSSGASSTINDGSVASQMSQISKKITQLTQKLKDIATAPGTPEEKRKQQEAILNEIKMLQAQLAQLQRKQAEETQQRQENKRAQIMKTSNSSPAHRINIYV